MSQKSSQSALRPPREWRSAMAKPTRIAEVLTHSNTQVRASTIRRHFSGTAWVVFSTSQFRKCASSWRADGAHSCAPIGGIHRKSSLELIRFSRQFDYAACLTVSASRLVSTEVDQLQTDSGGASPVDSSPVVYADHANEHDMIRAIRHRVIARENNGVLRLDEFP